MDYLISQFWAQRLSMDFGNMTWGNKPRNANYEWNSLQNIEKAVFAQLPEMKEKYKKSKEDEKRKWRENFGEQFQRHHLFQFISNNVEEKFEDLPPAIFN